MKKLVTVSIRDIKVILAITEILGCVVCFFSKTAPPRIFGVLVLAIALFIAIVQKRKTKNAPLQTHLCLKCKTDTQHDEKNTCVQCHTNSYEKSRLTVIALIIALICGIFNFSGIMLAAVLFPIFYRTRYSITITITEIVTLILIILNLSEVVEVTGYFHLWNAALLFGIGVLIYQIRQYRGNHEKTDHYCPKCGHITKHNKYDVCSGCQLDIMSSTIFRLVCFSLAFLCSLVVSFLSVKYTEWNYQVYEAEFNLSIVIIVLISLTLLYPIYMYPAKIARRTEHPTATAIFWLNLFLGATLIFWIVLLIWASNGGNYGTKEVYIQNPTPAAVPPPTPTKSVEDSFAELKRLHEAGMLSDEEFEEKRKELMSRI